MRDWPDSHPKARAMRAKRARILVAAEKVFLTEGFAGSSMEAIAREAGVALTTLYRHAESKEDLFAAVVTGACSTDDEAEQAALQAALAEPLPELLRLAALHVQEVLTRPSTLALIRVAIGEKSAFPHLADMVFDGFVRHFEGFLAHVIAEKAAADPPGAEAAARALLDRVLGGAMLRMLLGQPAPDAATLQALAVEARDAALRQLG